MSFFNVNPLADQLRFTSLRRSLGQVVLSLFGVKKISQTKSETTYAIRPSKSITFDLIAPDLIDAREVYVVDYEDGLLFDQVDLVAAAAVSVSSVPNVETLLLTVLSKVADNALVVINVDTVGDTDEAIESLMGLKMLCPDLPVIICSTKFSRNNFTQERKIIADASVRLPCSCAALALGIEAGLQNRNL